MSDNTFSFVSEIPKYYIIGYLGYWCISFNLSENKYPGIADGVLSFVKRNGFDDMQKEGRLLV